jgi:hypothetical protein
MSKLIDRNELQRKLGVASRTILVEALPEKYYRDGTPARRAAPAAH